MFNLIDCLIGFCASSLVGAPLYLLLENVIKREILQRCDYDVDEFIDVMDIFYGGKGEFYSVYKENKQELVAYAIYKILTCIMWPISSWRLLHKLDRVQKYLDRVK